MTRHRTTARGGHLLILAALLGLVVVASAAGGSKTALAAGGSMTGLAAGGSKTALAAGGSKTGLAAGGSKTGLVDGRPIVFPLVGDYAYTMNFGDARGQGAHEGIDIEHVPRRTPVVAAESGTIKWWTTSWRAGCMLYLYGRSGTTYLYIHLNNDLTDASEDRGGCKLGVAYTVPNGAKVTAGEQIAWSGDSGDAEGNYHLHFEVHPNDDGAVNPFPYLNAAERVLFPGRLGAPFSLGVRGEPIAAGARTLRIRATAVRWWPGGRWTPLVRERVVTLAVGKTASVDETLAAALTGNAIETLQAQPSGVVTAFTAKTAVTAAALRGKPGALVAVRVTRPAGTQVAIEGPAGPLVPGPGEPDETDDADPDLPAGV